MPPLRIQILDALSRCGDEISAVADLARYLETPWTTVQRQVEALQALKVLKPEGDALAIRSGFDPGSLVSPDMSSYAPSHLKERGQMAESMRDATGTAVSGEGKGGRNDLPF